MTNEQRIDEAVRILARGGRLVVAKNVAAALPTALGAPHGLPLGVSVQVCDWLPEDTVIAIARESGPLALARPWPASSSRDSAGAPEGDGANEGGDRKERT